MRVTLRNDQTGGLKEVKVGFSWTLLLFAGFFGVPLFMRGLNAWGQAFLVWSIISVISIFIDTDRAVVMGNIIGLLSAACAIFVGFKGNELTAKHLLDNGWSFVENNQVTQFAKMKWSLA